MKWIQRLREQHNAKIESLSEECNDLILRTEEALSYWKELLEDQDRFIDPYVEEKWMTDHEDLKVKLGRSKVLHYRKTGNYSGLISVKKEFQQFQEERKSKIEEHNKQMLKSAMPKARMLLENVEGKKLDQQQMECIIKDVHNHLVIAGAGTGKTTTVVGKVKYLLQMKKYKAEDFLVLSFTNASALEMKERIRKETGENIEVSTFHKLGLQIIKTVDNVMPNITKLGLRNFIKDQIQKNMESPSYLFMLDSYLIYNKVPSKSEFEFKTDKEYQEYLTLNPPVTFKNEQVKSYGEMDIANFLLQNGIDYVYEKSYKYDTRTVDHGQYHPDFYLPELDLYIEYFGVDRRGKVPDYFKGEDGKSATKVYQDSMKWKKEIHHQNNTKMVECYAYEKFEGNLLEKLKKKLEKEGATVTPRSGKELWEIINQRGNSGLGNLLVLFETLINLMESNGYEIEDVRSKMKVDRNFATNEMLLYLIEPIFNAYNQYLKEHQEIDFNDMINDAVRYIRYGRYTNPYKFVIVDEYQDISKSRFELLYALRESSNYDLFCVGDDWQSIYRFAGSDIGFILQFERYWGKSEISKIETTYRFPQQLIDLSGEFIMKNPAQIKKMIRGVQTSSEKPLEEIYGFNEMRAVRKMEESLEKLPINSSVFLLGRYSFDVDILKSSYKFKMRYNRVTGLIDVVYYPRQDLKIQFLTAHKSKGLQADYIFIINNKKYKMGFPSKIQDAPLLEILVEDADIYLYGEERRLFYVALTRAKKKVYLLTIKNQESDFVMEIRKIIQEKYSEEVRQ